MRLWRTQIRLVGQHTVQHGLTYPSILTIVALLLKFLDFCYYLSLVVLPLSDYFVVVIVQNVVSCFL